MMTIPEGVWGAKRNPCGRPEAATRLAGTCAAALPARHESTAAIAASIETRDLTLNIGNLSLNQILAPVAISKHASGNTETLVHNKIHRKQNYFSMRAQLGVRPAICAIPIFS